MMWIDVAGPPGVGKSTLTDHIWPPRGIPWDKKPYPMEWNKFIKVTEKLLKKIRHHPSINACKSMTQRSFRKMSTVYRKSDDRIYVQTGFIQRGLGIGWRLEDPEEISEYFEIMPVSIGAIILFADVDEIKRRNVERGKNRSYMVQPMERPRQIAVKILKNKIPLIEIDTMRPINECAADLSIFTDHATKIANSRTA